MDCIWTSQGSFRRAEYGNEKDLESAVLAVQQELFGSGRVYLDVKKLIGEKGVQQNIPDGYLIDLSGMKPRLFVVENELAWHEPLKHIAIQILQFSLAFESTPLLVRSVILKAINESAEAQSKCEAFASARGYDNVFHLVDWLVHDHESPFTALVVIDEMPPMLEQVLTAKFRFGVEILELARYENDAGDRIYRFEPFLSQLSPVIATPDHPSVPSVPLDQVDTVDFGGVETSVKELLIGEHTWYPVIVGGAMRPQIRYMAVYEAAPIHAIRYIAPVASIEPYGDTNRWVVNLAGDPQPVGPIRWVQGGKNPSGITTQRYTSRGRLESAQTLDDLW